MNSISENSSIGYILEVDLESPSELHELHNYDPLAPEKFEISQNSCQIIVLILQTSME